MIRHLISAAALLAASSWVHADCDPAGQKVGSLVKDKAPTYSAGGKVVGEVQKSAVAADTPILECNESLGLIKIQVAGGDLWLDRADANIVYSTIARKEKKPCIRVAQNKKGDQRTLGVAGAGSSEHCEPGGLPD